MLADCLILYKDFLNDVYSISFQNIWRKKPNFAHVLNGFTQKKCVLSPGSNCKTCDTGIFTLSNKNYSAAAPNSKLSNCAEISLKYNRYVFPPLFLYFYFPPFFFRIILWYFNDISGWSLTLEFGANDVRQYWDSSSEENTI